MFFEISVLFDLVELLGGDMAEGAALGRIFPLMDITADGTDPLFAAVGRDGSWLGSICLDGCLVIAVGAGGSVRENLSVHHFPDEQGMAAQIVGFHYFQRQEGIDPLGEVINAVGTAGHMGEISELVHGAAGLHAKVLEQRELRLGGDGAQIELPGVCDHIMGQISLDGGDGDTGGIVGHLDGGIDDAGVVLLPLTGGQNINAVGQIV